MARAVRAMPLAAAVLLSAGGPWIGCSGYPAACATFLDAVDGGSDSGPLGGALSDVPSAVASDAADLNLPPGEATTIALTGCAGPGYAADFDVGSQTFQLTVDTGSGTLALASVACASCDVTPAYQPGLSAQDNGVRVSDAYVLGTWQGEVYTDSVQLVGTSSPVTMRIAAIDSQAGFFSDGGCAMGEVPFAPQGIVGFGPSDLAVRGTDAFVTIAGASLDVFAVELCAQGGQLMVGGVDPTAGSLSGPAIYTPMTNSLYYGVELEDLQLAGVSLGFGAADFGVAAVDTGTSVLALPGPVFQSLASKIESAPAFTAAFAGQTSWLGTTMCMTSSFDLEDLDAELPALTLSFPGVNGGPTVITMRPTESYLPPMTLNGKIYYCSGIFENPSATGTIFGTSAMLGQMVIFDVGRRRVGFAPQTFCP